MIFWIFFLKFLIFEFVFWNIYSCAFSLYLFIFLAVMGPLGFMGSFKDSFFPLPSVIGSFGPFFSWTYLVFLETFVCSMYMFENGVEVEIFTQRQDWATLGQEGGNGSQNVLIYYLFFSNFKEIKLKIKGNKIITLIKGHWILLHVFQNLHFGVHNV